MQRGSGSVNQRTIDNLTEQLAERDTELLRTRLECQRLNNLVTNVQVKSDNAIDGGPKAQQHKRRNIELEKEVENWTR